MILFVDDDREVLDVSVELMEAMGYQVIACNSPVKALSKASSYKDRITTIVSDYCMPDMVGTDLIQAVEEIIPNIKKVLATGHAPRKIPADITVINKPYLVQTLLSALEKEVLPEG